ncbi:hypothetical protein APS_0772 [Acetobacter pasteurianus subsp. pasteurianus LMG 1262 = NBRC 106471]|nr:hypothetical protein APS_0772 [Acetobacter pasteurianus subsp. pasteurianus LMG 1262 = NBRC 106471]
MPCVASHSCRLPLPLIYVFESRNVILPQAYVKNRRIEA